MELKTAWKSLCLLVIFLAVTCRGFSSQQQDSWLKISSRPVCFGAKSSQYGIFGVPHNGNLAGIKLVHLSGYVSCHTNSMSYWSYWGCNDYPNIGKLNLNVLITKSNNEIILPLAQFFTARLSGGKWYKLPGYNSFSPDLVLPFFTPYSVTAKQELRLWYGEDLANSWEGDNGGRVCCNVYALYEN